MHDFLLAKEIIDELQKIIQEKNLKVVRLADIEIGMVAMAHDGHAEHTEDISVPNLEFGLKSIAKKTILENTEFRIKKVEGESWRIVSIEGE
jgi:Zn finger protein HypA/HybF involved in hydrogenase expression